MRRDHRQPAGHRPYDAYGSGDEAADITQQFWGATRGWAPEPPADDDHDTTGHLAAPHHDDGGDASMWAQRTGSMRVIRDSFASVKPRRSEPMRRNSRGGIDRTRSHGIIRPTDPRPADIDDDDDAPLPAPVRRRPAASVSEATLGELAAGRRAEAAAAELDWPDDDDWSLPTSRTDRVRRTAPPAAARPRREHDRSHDAAYDDEAEYDLVPLTPVHPLVERLGLGAVDPLLLRLGALVIATALVVGYAFASRSDGTDSIASSAPAVAAAPAAVAPAAASTVPTTIAAAPAQAPAPAPEQAQAAAEPASDDVADEPAADASDDEASSSGSSSSDGSGVGDHTDGAEASNAQLGGDQAATVTEPAERVEPVCALTYAANPGDSWYRIADEAGISPQELLDANLAGLDSVIFPGDEICLPEGATMPQPPSTTAAPTTTAAPAATTTTAAPTTTTAPTTTAARPAPASTDEVQRLIREIWPDELEEKALQVAWRESNYRANVYNGICCYGVFQIHWTAHRSWLDDYGILSTNDLFDARKNITAAYALYQRAGGWGPWGG